jgi:transposase
MRYQGAALSQTSLRRPSKFTPERIQQIKDLIARGETCEVVAAQIGVTVGTLKVTCSRLGISLRRPRVKTAEHGNRHQERSRGCGRNLHGQNALQRPSAGH